MSYSPPEATACDFDLSDGGIYVQPAATAANFDLADYGVATITAEIAMPATVSVGMSATATSAAGIAYASTHATISSAAADALDGIQIRTEHAAAITGAAGTSGNVDLDMLAGTTAGLSMSARSDALGQIAVELSAEIGVTASRAVSVEIFAPGEAGAAAYPVAQYAVKVAFSGRAEAGLTGSASALSEIHSSSSVAADLIASAAMRAGIAVGSVHGVRVIDRKIFGDMVTPDGRAFRVEIDTREFGVPAEDRSYTVEHEDRTFTVH